MYFQDNSWQEAASYGRAMGDRLADILIRLPAMKKQAAQAAQQQAFENQMALQRMAQTSKYQAADLDLRRASERRMQTSQELLQKHQDAMLNLDTKREERLAKEGEALQQYREGELDIRQQQQERLEDEFAQRQKSSKEANTAKWLAQQQRMGIMERDQARKKEAAIQSNALKKQALEQKQTQFGTLHNPEQKNLGTLIDLARIEATSGRVGPATQALYQRQGMPTQQPSEGGNAISWIKQHLPWSSTPTPMTNVPQTTVPTQMPLQQVPVAPVQSGAVIQRASPAVQTNVVKPKFRYNPETGDLEEVK